MESKDALISSLRLELEEFQAQSKEYEEALEQEISSKDNQLADLRCKLEETQHDLSRLRERYQNCEADLARAEETAKEYLRELEKHRAEKRELELLNDDWERSKRILEFSNQELEQKLNHAEEYMIMYKEELDELNQQNEVEIQRLKDQIRQLTEELSQVQIRNPAIDESQVKLLQEELQNAIEEKLKLKSELEKPKVHRTTSTAPIDFQAQIFEVCPVETDSQTDSDVFVDEPNAGGQSIRVFARVRKLLDEDCTHEPYLMCSNTSIDVKTMDRSARKTGRNLSKQFLFERVFSPHSDNREVFEACKETIEEVNTGGKVCIVAYGQTGSGKTYTMRGLIEQSLEVVTRRVSGSRLEISLQCIEVYNDLVRNLLTQESEGRSNRLTEFLSKSTIQLIDYSVEAIWELIAQANESRVTKFTDANERSSRSHLLVTFFVKHGDVSGKLMFVDLAGSERLSSCKTKGDILKETLCINKSLTSLQDVIAALEARAPYVPYRNSLLTTLLQPVLSSSTSKVLMMFMVSPAEEALSETLCTLSLGVRLKSIELGANIRNSLKAQQVERTFLLLEKEREEKFALLRCKEKLERDVNSYLQAMKDKDNKIAVLSTRIKLMERENFDMTNRLKKEAEDYRQQFHQSNRKCRYLQAKLDATKCSPIKNSSIETIEETPVRLLQTSLSPPREMSSAGKSQLSKLSKVLHSPKTKRPIIGHQSSPSLLDTKFTSLRLSGKT